MAGIPTSNILQPGAISNPYVQRQLISDLQLLTPQYYKQYVEKYGNEDFTWWLATYGGMEEVKNRNFFWFESRGKLQVGVQTAAAVTANTPGAAVTFQLAFGDHYNSGTQSPLRIGETVRVASTNVEGVITAIPSTATNAFTFTVVPKIITQSLNTAGSSQFLTTDVFLFGGDMDAGEASTSINPLIHLDEQYNNNITEMRESWSASDLAEMTEIFYNSGVSGQDMAGGAQAGTSYFTYKGLVKSNQRFINNVEFKLMRGNIVTNQAALTGAQTSSVGSEGIIPRVLADGETVGYTPGTLDIAKMHEITRIMDVNGCANDNMWLQDIFQRQNFSDGLFKEYPAGAYVWGSNEKSEEAAINYGVESLRIDGYMFKVKKYKQFNTEMTTGLTPQTDFFRNFGMICPQGEARDAKNVTKSYKNITVMYQAPPKGGTVGNGIRVWQWGGGSQNPTTGTMTDNIETITYRGTRVVAANQFIIVQAS
jgi:hypothetical protein